MAAAAAKLINNFSVPVPPPGKPVSIEISWPSPGATVGTTFTAMGTWPPPDVNTVSCDVNKQDATSITNDGTGNWTAGFDVPASFPNQVPLSAYGDAGGSETIWITVVGPAAGNSLIVLNKPKKGIKHLCMLQIRVDRRDPPPGGFALQLKFQGTEKADFFVGGSVPGDHIKECSVGAQKADSIVNQPDGKWYAVFKNVPPGDHDLKASACGSGVTDQVRVRIQATPAGPPAAGAGSGMP
jgi:hypothetical protein